MFWAAWDLLQWNPLWAAVGGDPSEIAELDRNVAWRHFRHGTGTMAFDDRHADEFAADLVADLRDATGRYPTDPRLASLVTRLRAGSPDFARRWSVAHVARHRSSTKTATATPAGPITLECDVLTVPGTDLRIVVYTAAAGTEDASKLAPLAVTGHRVVGVGP